MQIMGALTRPQGILTLIKRKEDHHASSTVRSNNRQQMMPTSKLSAMSSLMPKSRSLKLFKSPSWLSINLPQSLLALVVKDKCTNQGSRTSQQSKSPHSFFSQKCSSRQIKEEDLEEVSLDRELERASKLPNYKPPNGEFENFP